MSSEPTSAAESPQRCGTKGCANEPTEKVPDEKLPHVVYDLCASCATGMRALQGVELVDARDVPPLTFGAR